MGLILNPRFLPGKTFFVMTQRTEIKFEVEETLVLRQGEKIEPAFCPMCDATVKMATPQAFGMLNGLREREVFRLIERGELHFIERDRVLICLHYFATETHGF